MKKENLIPTDVGEHTGRVTRARAAAYRTAGQMPPLKAPSQQDQKRALRAKPTRTALYEKTNVPDNECLHKRKAVLQDATNVCCENSYRNCFNAITSRAKNSKQAKKDQGKVSKVAPSVAVNLPHLQTNSKTMIAQDEVKVEPKSEEAMSSTNLEETVPPWLSTIGDCGIDYNQLENQKFGMPSQFQIPQKKAVSGCLSGNLIISRNPDIKDIDSDHKNPQICSLYAPDIYSNLRVAELIRRPYSNFMESIQRDITQNMRGILVDWLVEVSEEYKLASDTLYLTVYLVDWFLSQNYIERQKLQLLGITCMLIASKYEEICAPRVEEFCFITDNTYTRGEVLKMECQVLNLFGFQISAPTVKSFLRRFLRAAQATYKSPSLELEYLANFLAELTLVDYGFLNFIPSAIAASAVFLARWTLDPSSHPWNPTLEHYTFYGTSDLKTIVVALQDLQLNTTGCPLNAIRMKYRQQKYKSVATLSSPKLLETLF